MDKERFYYDKKFLSSKSGRPIRLLSEYLFPLESFRRNQIKSTVVFFGSARIKDNDDIRINKPIRNLGEHIIEVNPYEGLSQELKVFVNKT